MPHEPVLLHEVCEALALAAGKTVVDATVGCGGHAMALSERLGPRGLLVGLDLDPQALAVARQRLEGLPARVELLHESYERLGSALASFALESVDAVLLDLGVNSIQLDSPGRGMSIRHDGPLDMRFDPSSGRTAYDLLATAQESELRTIFQDFGEERFSRRIAAALFGARREGTLPRTTGGLADLVARAVPPAARSKRIHPATRVFQALRIAVNDELAVLERGLEAAATALAPGGRLAVISFHSLEDRRVKRFMRDRMEPLFRKPVQPGAEERHANPRSRSAKLRAAAKHAASSDSPVLGQETRA